MGSVYFLTRKGKIQEPRNPAGKAVMEYCKEGHTPINSDEVKQCVPEVSDPQGTLDSLYRAGFLRKESEDNLPSFGFME